MRLRKKTIAVTTAAFVIAGTTAAVAFWTTGGSGTGTTTTAEATADVVLSTVVTGDPLVPGGSQSVEVLADNPNPAVVELGEISLAVSTSNPACGAGNFLIGTVPGGSVPSGPGFSLGSTTLTLQDLPTNQDACKNVTVTLALTAAAPVA